MCTSLAVLADLELKQVTLLSPDSQTVQVAYGESAGPKWPENQATRFKPPTHPGHLYDLQA